MRFSPRSSLFVPVGFAALAAIAVPGLAAAQSDFLFRSPVAAFGVRAGPLLYTANGDIFDEITTNLTLDRGDFRAPAVGAEFVLMPSSRLDVVLGFMWSRTKRQSEFRDWVEEVEQGGEVIEIPIEQTTTLSTIPVTASLRYLLLPRGRRVSDLAWLPRTVVPYVGGGAGITWFHFEQEGDFVDFQDSAIFTDYLETRGQQLTFHALAGLDYWFAARFGLNAEARYTHGSAEPNESFGGYDNLDLGGFQATLGLSFRW